MSPKARKELNSTVDSILSKEECAVFSQVVLSRIPLLTAYLDREIKYRFLNRAYEDWFGLQANECIGLTLKQVLGQEYNDRVKLYFAEALAGKEQKFETEIEYKNGGRKFVEVRYIPDFGNGNEVIGVVVIAQDMTSIHEKTQELEKAHSNAKASEHFLKLVVQNVPSMISVKDAKNNFNYRLLNRASERLYNITEAEVIGKTDAVILDSDRVSNIIEKDKKAFLEPEREHVKIEVLETASGERLLETRRVPVFDANNKPNLLISISEDITDRIRLAEEEERNSQMSRFIQAIDQAIAISDDFPQLVNNVTSLVHQLQAWSVIGFWILETGTDYLKSAGVKAKQYKKFEDFIELSKNTTFQAGKGLPGRVLAGNKVATIPDIALDENFPRREMALKNGLHSGIAFPISTENAVLGVVEFFTDTVMNKALAMEDDLTAIGMRLGQAIEKLQVKKALDAERVESVRAAERFEKIFRCSPNPILVFNEVGILECNDAAVKILGCGSKEELMRRHPAEFSPTFQPDGSSSKDKSMDMDILARKNGVHVFEWVHKKIDGTDFPVEVTLSHVTWGGKSALLVLWNDLSEKKRRELQMIQTSKLASLGEMSAGVAHEINNPLAIIAGTLGLIERVKDNPEKFQAKLESMRKSCDRISKIVSGLKKFSRSGERASFAAHSLVAIIREALVLTESKSLRHEAPIRFEMEHDCFIYCNEIEIEQVIINLVNNAIDAIKDRAEKWVSLAVIELENEIVLQITDSGPGIPESTRKKLFDPFFTTKTVGEGTGLGLSISKGILDEHKASISVLADCPNTCFEIRFPTMAKIVKSA